MNTPTQIDWARLAAYIDGEGSVQINERNSTRKTNWGSWLRVSVSNTNPLLMVWLKETFGGTIAPSKPKKKTHKPGLKWHVSCRTAAGILEQCLPYMILKRSHAEIALAWQKTLRGPGHRIDLATRTQRVELKDKLKVLNARGAVA